MSVRVLNKINPLLYLTARSAILRLGCRAPRCSRPSASRIRTTPHAYTSASELERVDHDAKVEAHLHRVEQPDRLRALLQWPRVVSPRDQLRHCERPQSDRRLPEAGGAEDGGERAGEVKADEQRERAEQQRLTRPLQEVIVCPRSVDGSRKSCVDSRVKRRGSFGSRRLGVGRDGNPSGSNARPGRFNARWMRRPVSALALPGFCSAFAQSPRGSPRPLRRPRRQSAAEGGFCGVVELARRIMEAASARVVR